MTEHNLWNENVQAVLEELDQMVATEPILLHHNGDRMRIEFDLGYECPTGCADLVDYLSNRNWNTLELDMDNQTLIMSGVAYEVN